MARELSFVYASGMTLFATCWEVLSTGAESGKVLDVAGGAGLFETPGATLDDYDIAMTEDGTTGHYSAGLATGMAVGTPYIIRMHERAAATPAWSTDGPPVGQGAFCAPSAIADVILDEALSGHQTAGTAGRALRIAASVIDETTASGTPTTTEVRLAAGSAIDDYYNDLEIVIAGGSLAGQARVITDYDGATKSCTVDEPFTSAPASGVAVIIRATHKHSISQIADGVLRRTTANAEASSVGDTLDEKTLLGAIEKLTHRVEFSSDGLTLTVYRADGTTAFFTQTATRSATAAPVTGLGAAT